MLALPREMGKYHASLPCVSFMGSGVFKSMAAAASGERISLHSSSSCSKQQHYSTVAPQATHASYWLPVQ